MANLLERASIVLTPTGFNNGEALCVKPDDGSGDFQFSRNSAATRVNSQGLVEDVQILSSNLVVNGDFSDGSANWTLQSEWSIGTNKAIYDNSGSGNLNQSFTWQVGKKYKITFDIGDFTTNKRFDIYSGVSFIKTATTDNDTSYTILFDGDGGSTFRFRGLTTESFSITNIKIIEITDDTNLPRINYEGGCGSWLWENQSTNLVTQSETYGSGTFFSITSGSTIDNTTSLSPSGENNATQVTSTGAGKIQSVAITTLSQNTDYSFSFYAKNVDATAVKSRVLAIGGSGGSNLTEISYVSELSTENWVRITHNFNTGTNTTFYLFMSNALNSGGTIQLWGAQLEQQSYATSYIPTEGTQKTRNQDVCTNGGTGTGLINSTEGVLYAEIAALANDGTNRSISLNNGSGSNRVYLSYTSGSNRLRVIVNNSSGTQVDTFKTISSITNLNKIAFKYKENDFALWVNGVEIYTDTLGSTFPQGTLTELDFHNGAGINNFYGKTKALAVWKEALSDEELTLLTTI